MALKRPTGTNVANLCQQCLKRQLHRLNAPTRRVPSPTPFVPDATTFLTLIGRGMSQHAAKIPSWEALFTLTSQQLKESGVEPPRARKYLLWWRERFRNGLHGIGGDLKEVKDGVAELRIAEVPSRRPMDKEATLTRSAGMRKVIVNVLSETPSDEEISGKKKKKINVLSSLAPPLRYETAPTDKPISGVRIAHASAIGGTGVEPVKGQQGVARLRAKDGLWEQRRGHKVDGGERRKAEVRAKRRALERKNAR